MDEEVYFADIRKHTTNSINGTVADVLNHLQYNYGQLMTHELIECEDIVKKTIYNPRDPIETVFYAVEELLKFSGMTGTSYTQEQSVNMAYIILQRTGKFGLSIREWNCMTQSRARGLGSSSFFGQRTKNSEKPTMECTTKTCCTIWLQGFRKYCSRNKS